MGKLLDGKLALVMGVLTDQSIAYAVAAAMREHGAEVCITCQKEERLARIEPLAQRIGASVSFCDTGNEEDLDRLVESWSGPAGGPDILVHSMAFARPEALGGSFLDQTDREVFVEAMDASVYSLLAVARRLVPLMPRGSSIMTMSYLAGERAFPSYNVMGVAKAALQATAMYLANELGPSGIRVNVLSPGPIKTMAARAITGFGQMQQLQEAVSPMRRNVSADEVGNAAVMLASDLASGITGQVLYVDGGYNIVGAPPA